ncbi:regulator of G-protein signaling 1 isoform X1 [Beta vulgaris subsp. vulgaris]|uniref:regulator of G-protein signaling 1 isoform X1 n=1 Tax=Beta vulgaris subsp. vulgaris TaxID=3555 RepID=UPI0020368CE3|nr:regulator of G-protein signaling 1 isoform X1 [Beta vulgaris subsp. vulgaris]
MKGCAETGGCPSDYVAVSVSALSLFLLLARSIFPFLYYKVSIPKGSAVWIPAIQILASIGLLVSVVMSVNLIKIEKRRWWQSCYIWAVWLEGPFGYGLLLSCRIVQVYHLYFIFVKKRLPPVRSHIFLPLVLLPWFCGAALIHLKKPLNHRCQMSAQWVAPLMVLHSLYVVIFVGFTWSIQHVNFRFDELKDLWRGVLVSTFSVVCWVVAYILNEIHENVESLRVASRFFLALMTSIFIVAFFSYSSSQPLLSQISLRKKECPRYESMGQALGITGNGVQVQRQSMAVDGNEPLDKLLLDKRFRQSFMAFADSCLAGESVHFYEEVLDLGELPEHDSVSRIYMARHIIQKYIVAGAPMEVNISHRSRQQILNSVDLAHPDLFKVALNELLQLIKTNLARDYWSSMFYMKFKEEADAKVNGHDMELARSWNVTPRLSYAHAADDPFHQDNFLKDSEVAPSQ